MKYLLSPLLALLAGNAPFAQVTVVNAASFAPGQPVAPGSFAAMFGQDLCPQTAYGAWVAPGQLPTTLGGCTVTVNGQPAMLHFTSPGQINFIVPQGAGSASIAVNGMPAGSMMIASSAPGVFAANGMGMGIGAILNGMLWTPDPFSVSTNGQTTIVAMYATGVDLVTRPVVSIGGMPAAVDWWGNAPGLAGLQQLNVIVPTGVAGTGRVPVTVTSGGVTSNVTYMTLLPTTAMMQGMPGWTGGMMMAENMARAHEMSDLAFNPANNTALVSDRNADVVRVISLASQSTVATIALPAGSKAGDIAVNANGTLAAVALMAKAGVALLDLAQNKVTAVVGTGNYPSHVAFAGSSLLVTNGAAGTVSVIDTASGTVTRTVTVGFGPSGIATDGAVAVVANLQGATLSVIRLADYSVTTIPLPAGTRPHEVALAGGKAVVTTPMSNGFLIVDLGAGAITPVDTGVWNAMGPGSVVTNGNTAYIANQMTASVTVADLAAARVLRAFSVDPGPHSLALNLSANQLRVLAEGTGTLDLVDLASGTVTARLNAGDTERQGGGMMGGQASSTQVTAAVQMLATAQAGTRRLRLVTSQGSVMGMMSDGAFTVTR